MTTPRVHRGRLATAILASVALVLAAPYVGVVRSNIRAAFPGQFSLIINTVVGLALLAAVGAGLARVRDRRLPRYAAMAISAAVAAAYAQWTASSDPAVRAVEHFHFVEYGAVTFLFYRVWRDRGDWSVVLVPAIAAFIVGAADEGFQWFLPARVGELRDVFLNAVAIGCGLVFSLGAVPPPAFRFGWERGSVRLTGRALALGVLTLAVFVHTVHLGVAIRDPQAGTFASRYTTEALAALGGERVAVWTREPPLTRPARMSREDQYMTEGLQHVQARNRAWEAGDVFTAWRENLILERHYAPVLDTPSYVAAAGHRWSREQRSDAEARARGTDSRPFTSAAYPYPVYLWRPQLLWLLAALASGGLWFFLG